MNTALAGTPRNVIAKTFLDTTSKKEREPLIMHAAERAKNSATERKKGAWKRLHDHMVGGSDLDRMYLEALATGDWDAYTKTRDATAPAKPKASTKKAAKPKASAKSTDARTKQGQKTLGARVGRLESDVAEIKDSVNATMEMVATFVAMQSSDD